MTGEQRVGLDIEAKALRRALRPQARLLLSGRRVIGRVDLRDREPSRVELQPILGAHRPLRIPVGLLHERLVGPRARSAEHDVTIDLDTSAQLELVALGLLGGGRHARHLITESNSRPPAAHRSNRSHSHPDLITGRARQTTVAMFPPTSGHVASWLSSRAHCWFGGRTARAAAPRPDPCRRQSGSLPGTAARLISWCSGCE